MGICIAMDDFGTGYSSLSYLKKFPIDTIKIDRFFIADLETDVEAVEIIKAIITMGQSLNSKIVAEGVETKEQISILKKYQATKYKATCSAARCREIPWPNSTNEKRFKTLDRPHVVQGACSLPGSI